VRACADERRDRQSRRYHQQRITPAVQRARYRHTLSPIYDGARMLNSIRTRRQHRCGTVHVLPPPPTQSPPPNAAKRLPRGREKRYKRHSCAALSSPPRVATPPHGTAPPPLYTRQSEKVFRHAAFLPFVEEERYTLVPFFSSTAAQIQVKGREERRSRAAKNQMLIENRRCRTYSSYAKALAVLLPASRRSREASRKSASRVALLREDIAPPAARHSNGKPQLI